MDCLKLRWKNRLLLVTSLLFWLTVNPAYSGSDSAVVCTGDRVNVRSRPDINSEIVAQLSSGQPVYVLEERGDWTKIKAPRDAQCWVHGDYVKDGTVTADRTNLRCGPGIAYPSVAMLNKGTAVDIVEFVGDWVKIGAPVDFTVWVNSAYLASRTRQETAAVAEEEGAAEIEITSPGAIVADTTYVSLEEYIPETVSVAVEEYDGIAVGSYFGVLENLGVLINRPGTYKLVGEDKKWICILRSPELDINPYVNRIVRVEAVIVARSSSWNVPVVEVKRLTVVK